MRYVPNLISENLKVLPDYFKGNIYKPTKKNLLRDTVLWIIGVFFFVGALGSVIHPLMTLVFGLIGFILVPPGHRFIERKLKFRLTPKIKTMAVSALFISAVPLTNHYADVDQKIAAQQKMAEEKAAKEKAIADQKEQQRKDSLAFYMQKSNQLIEKQKLEEANEQLERASSFVSGDIEKEKIEREKYGIKKIKTIDLVKKRNYKKAIAEINDLLNTGPSNSELIYNRAFCNSRLGNVHEAVNDLKPLIQEGNSEAQKLHEKINPIRKRVAYYVTRCCDGTTSNASGRGACSHHGGVCNWNEPVYEEYRKY